MIHNNFLKKGLFATCLMLVVGVPVQAQFTETMGTAGSSPSSIATHETNNRFLQTALTYSGTADMRTTLPSTGYPGASGSFNVLIQAQETFIAAGIDASLCEGADSLAFGVHKNTNASTGIDYLVLEYSTDNGASWVNLPFAALPTGSGTAIWYQRKLALPAAAQVTGLQLRFRSTLTGSSSSNPQFRIDDLALTCTASGGGGCEGAELLVETDFATTYCSNVGPNGLLATTNLSNPQYQWYNQNGSIAGATSDLYTTNTSGTYSVVVSNSDGCELESDPIYLLVYPQPELCPLAVEGCEGDTVTACANLKANGLLISEYVEGTGNNKYLELYNGTCDTIDLAAYQVRAYHNGVTVPTYTITLSGLLAPATTFVIANPSATAWSGTPDLVTGSLAFNGNDALVVYNTVTASVADFIGAVGFNPITAWQDTVSSSPTFGWSTVNKTLVRKACVYSGLDTFTGLDGIYGFPTLLTEWDTLSVNDVSNLGSHTFGAAAYSFGVAAGDASIIGSTDNCVTVVVGSRNSLISADVTLCDFNNCSATNNLLQVNHVCNESRSLATDAAANMVVYPNPTNGEATLRMAFPQAGAATLRLTDLSGKVVWEQTWQAAAGTNELTMDLNGLKAGSYLCTVDCGTLNAVVRITKQQ